MARPDLGPGRSETSVARAAALLRSGVADPDGLGLLVRGWEHRPVLFADLDPASALGIAAAGLLRLSNIAERASGRLAGHPDPRVRRSCALLAAGAHPLLEGLEAPGAA